MRFREARTVSVASLEHEFEKLLCAHSTGVDQLPRCAFM